MDKDFFISKNIILSKGYCRSVICDFSSENSAFFIVPNSLIEFLEKYNNYDLSTLSKDEKDILETYNSFLIEQNIALNYNSNFFLPLNKNWDFPSIITNVSIDCELNEQIIEFISGLNCFHYKVYIDNNEELNNLKTVLNKLVLDSKIESIEIVIKDKLSVIESDLNELLLNPYIHSVLIFNSKEEINNPINKISNFDYSFENHQIPVLNSVLLSIPLYTESLKHHTYFNRKLHIGNKGEVKNDYQCLENFGNINEIKNIEQLKTIIGTKNFQKLWHITKEDCDVCKDCEFMNMCVDSRLAYKREDGSWYHKTECNYNPYTNTWKGSKNHKSLGECGVISNKGGFNIDHIKIEKINQEIWSN